MGTVSILTFVGRVRSHEGWQYGTVPGGVGGGVSYLKLQLGVAYLKGIWEAFAHRCCFIMEHMQKSL